MPRPKALLIAAPGIFRDQLAQQLAGEEGSDIVTASTLEEARAVAADGLFAFAVIDDALPGDGATTARALEEDGFSAPMLLLAADQAQAPDGLTRLAKPFRVTALVQALGKLLAHP